MRLLSTVVLALVASPAAAGCPYAERAATPAARGCPYAEQAAKRDDVHTPVSRQAVSGKKGIFYSKSQVPLYQIRFTSERGTHPCDDHVF